MITYTSVGPVLCQLGQIFTLSWRGFEVRVVSQDGTLLSEWLKLAMKMWKSVHCNIIAKILRSNLNFSAELMLKITIQVCGYLRMQMSGQPEQELLWYKSCCLMSQQKSGWRTDGLLSWSWCFYENKNQLNLGKFDKCSLDCQFFVRSNSPAAFLIKNHQFMQKSKRDWLQG